MAELHWCPVFVADWLTSDAITLMRPEQEGAFFRLLLRAWGKGELEPCLPDDDAKLATLSRLGRRWGKLGPLIREQFVARDGALYNVKLSAVWEEQQKKHGQAVVRGQNSAKARQVKLQTVSKQSPDSGQQLELERELEREEATSSSSADVARLLAGLPTDPMCLAWASEINVAREGMHGTSLSDEQIDRACRAYVGNGHLASPSLRHFRAFLADVGRPPRASSPNGENPFTTPAMRQWAADQDAKETTRA